MRVHPVALLLIVLAWLLVIADIALLVRVAGTDWAFPVALAHIGVLVVCVVRVRRLEARDRRSRAAVMRERGRLGL